MTNNNYNGALQQPIDSGFSANSTTENVIKDIDLKGKIAIVTGGNTGIGLETVKVLSKAGATVVVPARDVEKAKKNLQDLNNVEIEELDLTEPVYINTFAEKFLASGRPLHLLINNAGIMFVPLRRNSKRYESQLAVNFLAVFQLTSKLWEPLKKASGARVINLSSQGHQFAPFDFDDPNWEKREYQTLQAYGHSKTAVNLFTLELDNRAKAFGVRAYAVHPGNIWGTELTREAPVEILQQFGFVDEKGNPVPEVINSLKTISQGAATTVWAATSPLLKDIGGVYLEDVDVAGLALGSSFENGVKPYSLEETSAKQLWDLAEKLTDITFKVY